MRFSRVATIPALLTVLSGSPVRAADPVFQDFFFSVCENPTGALASRCAETTDGLGNLSGDSESSLNPSQALSSNKTPLANAREKISTSFDRIQDLKGGSAESGSSEVMIGPFSLLLNGNRGWVDRDPGIAERGYDGDIYGIELGLDYRLSDSAVIGGFIGYENTDFEYSQDQAGVNFTPQSNSGTTDSDTYSLSLFGSFDLTDQLYVDAVIGASSSEHSFERNVVFQESTRTTPQTNVRSLGNPDGNEYWLSLSGGLALGDGPLTYTPYVKASFARSKIDAYVEEDKNGSGLNMRVESAERESLTTDIGIRASYAVNTDWGVLVPQAHIEYEHEFDEDAQESRLSYALDANNNEFALTGDDPDRDYFNAGAGVVAIFPGSLMIFINYTGLIDYDDLDRHQLTAGIRREF